MNTLINILTIVNNIFKQENFIFEPETLYTPIDYTLAGGGKRIRPTLLLSACEMFGGDISKAQDAALGIETFHNFTLLHDDLMDQSPIRRGRPTVYRKWSPNTAILSGDTMLSMAWRYFLRQPHAQLQTILNTFNETCIQIMEGQQYDMDFENSNDVTTDDYMKMITLKTAVLLASALKTGALYANAPERDQEEAYQFGIHLGLAFQLQDDLLDAYGDVATFGKQTGTDICDNKKTFLYLKALSMSDSEQKATLQHLFSSKPADPSEKIQKVLSIYNTIGIRKITEQAIEAQFELAEMHLKAIRVPEENKQPIVDLAKTLLNRDH